MYTHKLTTLLTLCVLSSLTLMTSCTGNMRWNNDEEDLAATIKNFEEDLNKADSDSEREKEVREIVSDWEENEENFRKHLAFILQESTTLNPDSIWTKFAEFHNHPLSAKIKEALHTIAPGHAKAYKALILAVQEKAREVQKRQTEQNLRELGSMQLNIGIFAYGFFADALRFVQAQQ